MFVARTACGRLFSLYGRTDRSRLIQLRQNTRFFCPACGQAVHMKLGWQTAWHFAHEAHRVCPGLAERESAYHLEGKRQLYGWFRKRDYATVLEPYFPDINRRPDLFVPRKKWAVEYQCSPLPLNDFVARTKSFLNAGCIPLWILGGNRLKPAGPRRFRVTATEWPALFDGEAFRDNPHLFFYCAEQQKFARLAHLMPLSATSVYAALQYVAPSELSFNRFFSPPPAHFRFPNASDWYQIKKKWRQWAPRSTDPISPFVRQILARHNLALSQFPPFCGIPTRYAFWIETPLYLWQSAVYFALITSYRPGTRFSFYNIFVLFSEWHRKKWIRLRRLPLIKHSHPSFALLAYLDELSRRGILKKVDKNQFLVTGKEDMKKYKTVDSLLEADRRDLHLKYPPSFAQTIH